MKKDKQMKGKENKKPQCLKLRRSVMAEALIALRNLRIELEKKHEVITD